jgi:hypothetical protein
MQDSVRALEGARSSLARALRRGLPTAARAEAASYDLVDDLVGGLLLGYVGAIGEVAIEDLVSGSRTIDALRAITQTWWVWRPGGMPWGVAAEVPAAELEATARAADAWVRGFEGTPADVLLACHELRLAGDRDARRKNGAFYTPSVAAAALVDDALATVTRRPGKPPRILDPACGTGAFLVAAFRRLVAAQIDQPMEGSFARRLALAAATLHGVDSDARAVDLARRAVLLTVLDDPRVHEELALALAFPATGAIARAVGGIVHGDSLLGLDAPAALGEGSAPPVDWPRVFSAAFAAGGFDIVIGNPPFASYGGREGKPIDPALRVHVEQLHGAFRWPSLHGWFLATAARFWGRDTVAFVLPEQVLHLGGYADLRARVRERFAVSRAVRLGDDTFGDAVVPSATVVLKRLAADLDAPVDSGPWLSPERPRALERLIDRGSSLRGWLLDCGVRTTDRTTQVRRIGEGAGSDAAGWTPVLEGKDIGIWRTGPPRVEVRLGEGVHAAPRSRYERTTYVLRQTASYPICARKVGAALFRNSLLGLAAPEDATCDVRYVAAFLNSRLGRYLYVVLVQEAAQRVFPQVKIGALARLPIRMPEGPVERALHDRVVGLVEERLGAGPDAAAGVEAAIDRAIEDLHGVDDALREAMIERIATLPKAP